jgi:phosphopantothenoylcysteine decarboxylase / phosphopantothenate---cysteine ligase
MDVAGRARLPCRRLLVGVGGPIRAPLLVEYLVQFRRQFAEQVRVIMTAAATQVVPPRAVEVAADAPVVTDLWGRGDLRGPHVRLARWADLFVVVPATATILGKAAHGLADDLLSLAVMASEQPVVFAPSMSRTMWCNPVVQRNVVALRADGHYVVQPPQGAGTGVDPSPAGLLPHLWHMHLRRRQSGYWAKATAAAPRLPAPPKTLPVIPLDVVRTGRPSTA